MDDDQRRLSGEETRPMLHVSPEGQTQLEDQVWAGGSKMTLAYVGVLLFVLVYFLEPSHWITAVRTVPFAKISGGIALASFVFGYVGSKNRILPKQIMFLALLFLQLCFAIPFAVWKGGAFDVVIPLDGFLGVTLIATAVTFAVTTLRRLYWLVFIQTACLAFMAYRAITEEVYRYDVSKLARLTGLMNYNFADSNDFAVALTLVIPFCFMFHFLAKNVITKIVYAAILGLLLYSITLTYSRSGSLTLMVVLITCIWEFGKKRRRYALPLLLLIGFIVLVAVVPTYQTRLLSIVNPALDATGSRAARQHLLISSIKMTLRHPIFGVGPGNFEAVSGTWHANHNNYLQLSSEAGIPALVLFLLVLKHTFGTLRRIERTGPPQYQAAVSGLKASMIGLVVASLFWNSVYSFTPYLLVAYVAALGRMVAEPAPEPLREGEVPLAEADAPQPVMG